MNPRPSLAAAVAALLAALCTVVVLTPEVASAADPCIVNHGEIICTWNYNGTNGVDGSVQSWTVPANVTYVTVETYGAQGGYCLDETAGAPAPDNCPAGNAGHGGPGGQAVTRLFTTPGEVLKIRVGGQPSSSGAGGYNGGGAGTAHLGANGRYVYGGGGGGASDVRKGGDGLANRVAVGGGGGGSGPLQIGVGGGGNGGGQSGAVGGCYSAAIPPAGCKPGDAWPGSGGGPTQGGAPNGLLGVGGDGLGQIGSGGGGGFYGGGGSDSGASGGSTGGGGGSGYVAGGCATPLYPPATCTAGGQYGNGLVRIRYQPELPGAPTITKVLPNDGAATVTWTPPTNLGNTALTGYDITPYVGGVAQPVQSFTATKTTAKVVGLTNGTTYRFRVAAVNSVGAGAQSLDSDPLVVGTPSAPGFQAASPGNGDAKVAWLAPANNGSPITGYQVTPYLGGSTPGSPQAFGPAATSVVVSGLTNTATYTFAVQAINAFGPGATAVTLPIVVGAPTPPIFPVAVPGSASARIGWSASIPNAAPVTNYTITPYLGSNPAGPPVTFGTGTIQTMTGLTNGAVYTFRVEATNAVGTSPAASTPAIKVGTPAQPGFQSASPGNGSATVFFTTPAANASAITGYTVTPYVGSTPLGPQTFGDPAATHLVVTGLTNGTAYTFRVHANNAIGAGPDATTAAITVGTPAAPGFPLAAPGNASAKVAWTAPNANGSPITGYVITPYLGATALAPQTFASTATAQVVSGLTNGSSYSFRVAAINSVGTGPTSTTPSIKVGSPTAPGFPRATALGGGSAKVSWNASTANASPITGYVVTPVIGTSAQAPQTFASTATTQTINGLTPGTTYTFRVAAINAIGTGPYSTSSALVI